MAQDPSEVTSGYGSTIRFALALFQRSTPTLLAYGGTYAKHELSDLLNAMMAPVRPYGSIFLNTGGAQKSLRGNYQFLRWIRTELVEL